jgi:methyl-accepting chemotaxis protein
MGSIFSTFGRKQALGGDFAIELVRQMVVPTFVLGAAGRVLVWNKACEDLTGLKADSVVGTKDHWRGFYAAPRPCLADLVLTSGATTIATYSNIRFSPNAEQGKAENWCDLPNGSRRYLAIDAGKVRDQKGRIVAVVETLRDLTVEQEALARLNEDQAESRKIAADEQSLAIRMLGQGMHALAQGELGVEMTQSFPDAYRQLQDDFNTATRALCAAMTRIRGSSENVGGTADEIASGSAALAQRAEHQAAMLEETTAAHHQITATVNRTLKVSREAAAVVAHAKDNATQSRGIVDETVVAIQSIEQSSRQITQIITIIKSIVQRFFRKQVHENKTLILLHF